MKIQAGKASYFSGWRNRQTKPTAQIVFSAAETFADRWEKKIEESDSAWEALRAHSEREIFRVDYRFGDISTAQNGLFSTSSTTSGPTARST